MRAWKVYGKYRIYDDDGNITHTEIALISTSGNNASITEKVVGDHTKKTDEELIKLGLDEFFKSEYADKAMSESVKKVDELERQVEENKRLGIRLQQAIDEANASAVANKETVDNAVVELTELVTGVLAMIMPQTEGEEDGETDEELIQ